MTVDLFVVVWTCIIFTSICWYAALLFIIGKRGADDIKAMIRALGERSDPDKKP